LAPFVSIYSYLVEFCTSLDLSMPDLFLVRTSTFETKQTKRELFSVGLQGSCILFLDHDRFDLTVEGRRRLFQATAIYSRLPFSCRLPFRSITDYLTHGNTLIYLYLDPQSKSNHLSLHLVFDPRCATDTGPHSRNNGEPFSGADNNSSLKTAQSGPVSHPRWQG
jgi:hypothetical protein